MKNAVTTLCAASLVLAACAGREANPVQVIQAGDASLSCRELRQEVEISSATLNRLLGDQKSVSNKNAAAVAVGAIVFFPALFFMNLKGAAGEEAKALQERMTGLAQRHNGKGCKPPIVIKTADKGDKAAAKKP